MVAHMLPGPPGGPRSGDRARAAAGSAGAVARGGLRAVVTLGVRSIPAKPVACNYELLSVIDGLLWGIAPVVLGYLAFRQVKVITSSILKCTVGV